MTILVNDDDGEPNEIVTPTHFVPGKVGKDCILFSIIYFSVLTLILQNLGCACEQRLVELADKVRSIKDIVVDIKELLHQQPL